MTRICSYLLLTSLITLVGCGSKKPPPTPPAPERLDKAPTVVVPATPDKDRAAKDKDGAVDPTKINPEGKGAFTRDQFRGLVLGKTKEEVLRRLGPPETTGEDQPDEYLYYHDKTRNEDGSIDELANVVLHKGVVKRVTFKPRD